MKTTARFEINRRSRLKTIFRKEQLVSVWRDVVKEQLRRMEIKDLHDYYDFNIAIESKSERIVDDILGGRYKVDPPLIYKTEKKLGICRHLMMPSPSDALVFQVLVESIRKKTKPPSKQAYYSMDKHSMKLPHEYRNAYTWFENWKKFQHEIWGFTKAYDFIVVTDLSNFYDSIELSELRHVIASRIKADEVVLDLLFKMIEQLSWNPDYLPYSGRGLPTINIEAPRFLAHCFLYEIDEVLMKTTNSSFVRWMDDINFAAKTEIMAKQSLNIISDVLKSRGLSFNMSKTKILTSSEAEQHFWVEENIFLDSVLKLVSKGKTGKRIQRKVSSRFENHIKKNLEKTNSSKITKRYLTILTALENKVGLKYIEKLFLDCPDLRDKLCDYLGKCNFSKETCKIIENLFKNQNYFDDVALFYLAECLISWNIPKNKMGNNFIKRITNHVKSKTGVFNNFCLLWFMTKYSEDTELYNLINTNKREWLKDSFMSRQVISALPRIVKSYPDFVDKLLTDAIESGSSGAAAVALNLREIMSSNSIFSRINLYLLPTDQKRDYQLAKVLISLALSSNPNLLNKDDFIFSVSGRTLFDEWYTGHLFEHLSY